MRTYTNLSANLLVRMLTSGLAIAMAADDAVGSLDSGENDLSLADLADLDVSDIEEVRFSSLPAGVFTFVVENATTEDDISKKDDSERFKTTFELKITDVHAVTSPGFKKDEWDSLIGRKHSERFFIPKDDVDGPKAIGRVKAFIADMGLESKGKYGAVVESTIGHEFKAKGVQRANPNDKTQPFFGIKFDPPKKR